MVDMNYCDKCKIEEESLKLVWIDSEDFEPLETDNFNGKKCKKAIKKGYSALYIDCYKEECCD